MNEYRPGCLNMHQIYAQKEICIKFVQFHYFLTEMQPDIWGYLWMAGSHIHVCGLTPRSTDGCCVGLRVSVEDVLIFLFHLLLTITDVVSVCG